MIVSSHPKRSRVLQYGLLALYIVFLGSAVTWLPGLVVFALQGYLEGASWTFQNLWIAGAIVVGSWIWILLLALLSLAISALVRRAFMARGALVLLYVAPGAVAAVVNEVFNTRWGSILSLNQIMSTIWITLFQSSARVDVPPAAGFETTCCALAAAAAASSSAFFFAASAAARRWRVSSASRSCAA